VLPAAFWPQTGVEGTLHQQSAWLSPESNAPDLKTELRYFARFHPVLANNHLEFVESAGTGRIEFSYPVTMPNVVQLTDFVLMRFVTQIRAAAGNHWRPVAGG
jgi:hypothetical protein